MSDLQKPANVPQAHSAAGALDLAPSWARSRASIAQFANSNKQPTDSDMRAAIERIGQGANVREAAASVGISPSMFWQFVKLPAYRDLYDAAKALKADLHVSVGVAAADAAADGSLDPRAAKIVVDAHNWLAARLDRTTYGDRQSIDVNVQVDVASQLDEAAQRVRSLAREPITIDQPADDDLLGF